MKEVVIVGAARTAIGSFGGTLKSVPASTLGAIAVKEAIKRAGITPEMVEEVIMGNVLQAGLGQNVARQISMEAGIPKEVPSMTLNKAVQVLELLSLLLRSSKQEMLISS